MVRVEMFKEQSYVKLRKACLNAKELFEDPLFPANDHSLGIPSSRLGYGRVIWKRPGDLGENPRLFVDKASSKDVTQGRLGNCWFVAACSALATVKALWSFVVPDYKDQEWDVEKPETYTGMFHFRFWRFGKWIDVVVDDYLPTMENQLIFCHSTTESEFWSALLEKAYAKLCGSYGAMDGGNLCDALVDFTSGLGEIIELKNGGYQADDEKRETLRKQLLRKHDEHALMCCAIAVTDSSLFEARTKTGLIMGHAYGITAVKEINLGSAGLLSFFKSGEKLTLIKLRNPWGAKEWTGPFSDGPRPDVCQRQPSNCSQPPYLHVPLSKCGSDASSSNGCCSVSALSEGPGIASSVASFSTRNSRNEFAFSTQQCLQMNSRSPEWTKISKDTKEKLGLTFEDDGEFWMPFEDFVAEFTDLSVCHLINTSLFTLRKTWYESFHLGEWTKPSQAGGCPNHPTFLQNPQYCFDVPKDDMELIVQLVQADTRGQGGFSDSNAVYNSIGFHIMKVEDNREHRTHVVKKKAVTSDYVKTRSVYFQGTLSRGRHILVPTTFQPNVETEFMLRLFTEEKVKVKELKKDYPEPSWICAPFCSPPSCVTLLTVEGAAGLAAANENTFCIIKVESERLKSQVVYGSQEPQWNLSGVFFRYDVCKPMFVELWEKRFFKDRFLGCAVISGAADNELTSNKLPLVGRGRKQSDRHPGELKVTTVTYDDLNAT